jgi:hypothetical protein
MKPESLRFFKLLRLFMRIAFLFERLSLKDQGLLIREVWIVERIIGRIP